MSFSSLAFISVALSFFLIPSPSMAHLFPPSFGRSNQSPNHHQLIKRDPQSPSNHHSLSKRSSAFTGKATFYDPGLGACGSTDTKDDFIVALNKPQFDANKWCDKYITITFNKRSHTARIRDECPGCSFGALDMSPALFNFFANPDVGIFFMSWTLNDDDSAPKADPTPPPPPAPKPDPPKEDPKPIVQPQPEPQKPEPKPEDQPKPADKPVDQPKPADKPVDQPKPADKPVDQPKPVDYPPPYTPPANINKPANTSPPVYTFPVFKPAQNSSNDANNQHVTTNSINPTTTTNQQPNGQPQPQTQQKTSAYATGGNLDSISQLVISFGSLTAACADNALKQSQ